MESLTADRVKTDRKDARQSKQQSLYHISGRQRDWHVVALLILLAWTSFWLVDYTVSHFFVASKKLPGDFTKLLDAAEHFGTPFGMGLILWVVFLLDRSHAYRIPRLASTGLTAGLMANVIKMCVSRYRPEHFEFVGNDILDSFVGLFQFLAGGSALQSFPSAHTSTAVAFAVGMSWAYPKAASAFYSLAVLVALERIYSGAHFLSDTFVGALVGWLVGGCFVGPSLIGNWWTQREQIWSQRTTQTPL